MKNILLYILVVSSLILVACTERDQKSEIKKEDKPLSPFISGLEIVHYPVRTNNPEAQKFFDQGLALTYGFNHAEAHRSFLECARLDPDCAMCYWGIGFALGPNINAPMFGDNVPKAWEALQKALQYSENGGEKEKDLISALSKRYGETPPPDRSHLDAAFADAMRELAKKYPDDVFIVTLTAESLMDLHPWDYYTKDGQLKEWTPEILDTLQAALKLDGKHPQANHLYIHAVEASNTPELGLASANNLRGIVPGAGHLVHMPSHTYIRTAHYADALTVNELATQSDESYFEQLRAQGFDIVDSLYRHMYYPHNYHYQMFAASMMGNKEKALKAADNTRKAMLTETGTELMKQPGWSTLQHFYSMPVFVRIRFGVWDEIIAEQFPEKDLLYPRAVLHYGRGLAFASRGDIEKANAELKSLKEILADEDLDKMAIWDLNRGPTLITIAKEVLLGEIAAAKGDYETAIFSLLAAMEIEEALIFDEPPSWTSPSRQRLGAILLAAGKPVEAETVYRRELKRFADNGWSLMGLQLSLEAQGRHEEAKKVQARFKDAWKDADIAINASVIK
jgi:tetratricopeptide (TPR) repeat protein